MQGRRHAGKMGRAPVVAGRAGPENRPTARGPTRPRSERGPNPRGDAMARRRRGSGWAGAAGALIGVAWLVLAAGEGRAAGPAAARHATPADSLALAGADSAYAHHDWVQAARGYAAFTKKFAAGGRTWYRLASSEGSL